MRGSREEKGKVVAMLVECGKKRTYLSLPAVTLLNILVETVSCNLKTSIHKFFTPSFLVVGSKGFSYNSFARNIGGVDKTAN